MKRCPKGCPIIIGGEHKNCYICGSELVENEKCSCGEELHQAYKFCPKCGKEV